MKITSIMVIAMALTGIMACCIGCMNNGDEQFISITEDMKEEVLPALQMEAQLLKDLDLTAATIKANDVNILVDKYYEKYNNCEPSSARLKQAKDKLLDGLSALKKGNMMIVAANGNALTLMAVAPQAMGYFADAAQLIQEAGIIANTK